MRGPPGTPSQNLHVLFLFGFSLLSLSSTLPPVFLFQLLARPSINPPATADGCLSTRVSASPSLTNTYPLGDTSTLVPGSFSVNTSLVCAMYLFTFVYFFRFKPSAFTVQWSGKISGVEEERGASALRLAVMLSHDPDTSCHCALQPRMFHLAECL